MATYMSAIYGVCYFSALTLRDLFLFYISSRTFASHWSGSRGVSAVENSHVCIFLLLIL